MKETNILNIKRICGVFEVGQYGSKVVIKIINSFISFQTTGEITHLFRRLLIIQVLFIKARKL